MNRELVDRCLVVKVGKTPMIQESKADCTEVDTRGSNRGLSRKEKTSLGDLERV